MTEPGFTVFIVDDEPSVRKALSRLLGAWGYDVRTFASPKEFLAQHDPSIPGCALLDFVLPDLDGLAVHAALSARGVERPVIFISGQADIATSVQAMKAGAVDFLTKPVSEDELLTAIERAEEKDTQGRQIQSERASIRVRLTELTPRETEVLTHVVAGRLNRQIARDLGTAERTIKVHRARVMQKMGARTVPDLVRLAEKAGIPPQMSFNGATTLAPTDRREFKSSRGSPYIQRPNLASLLRASPSR